VLLATETQKFLRKY